MFQRGGTVWEFYPISNHNNSKSWINALAGHLKYWDLLELSLVLPAIIVTLQRKKTKINNVENSEGFVQDNPVESLKDDSFGRNKVAKQIADMIGFTDNRRAFAIGILGEYGSGKTSFLNLVNDVLLTDNFVKIQFNPWNSESSSFIHKDFFDQLANTVADLDPKISSLLYSYSRKISRIDDASKTWVNRINLLVNPNSSDSSDEKLKINTALRRSEKKIIITIDDLDRLHNDEVIEV